MKSKGSVALTTLAIGLLAGCVGELSPQEWRRTAPEPVVTPDPVVTPNPDPTKPPVVTPDPDMGQVVVTPDAGPTEPEPVVRTTPWGALPPAAYARKVKFMLHGGALTSEELSRLQADPATMRDLVDAWTQEPEFREKMRDFFMVTLQQDEVTRDTLVSQIRGRDGAGDFNPPGRFYQNLRESFARTAVKIVEDGQPFTRIATTNRWMVTTSMLTFLAAIDNKNKPRDDREVHRFYHEPFTADGVTYNADTPLRQQIANRTWYIDHSFLGYRDREDCASQPYVPSGNERAYAWSGLLGRFECSRTDYSGPMSQDDFSDWREVEFTTLAREQDRVPYYDILAMRRADTLALSIPRVGFFTTPSFLAKWRTNIDNSFRVTTNQTLIVGLGKSFESENFTMPLTQDNLGTEHADPTTVCYGCHVQLDPMRNFFALEFDADTYEALDERPDYTPSFGFVGLQRDGTNLHDLGSAVAEHPLFAQGWVQKMCLFANSQECDVQDPEFKRVEQAFIDSGYDFRAMLVELFSSPLITSTEHVDTHETHEYQSSISRRAHVCHALEVRFAKSGYDFDPCASNNKLAPAIPADAWARGAVTPFQPAGSSLFYSATLESFCERMANLVVDREDSPLQSRQMDQSIDYLVQHIMGVPTVDPRYDGLHTLLTDHVAQVLEYKSGLRAQSLRSATTLACSSPFMTSTDF